MSAMYIKKAILEKRLFRIILTCCKIMFRQIFLTLDIIPLQFLFYRVQRVDAYSKNHYPFYISVVTNKKWILYNILYDVYYQ